MNEIVQVTIPEPINHNGRDRFVCGWSTAGIGQWLLNKKLGEQYTPLAEIAFTAYGRDSQTNQEKVRNNTAAVRRWLADRDEFLLVKRGSGRRTIALKVCNSADDNDRQVATEQLISLEARCEITQAERIRWEQMLYLPSSEVTVQQENQS